MVTQTNWTDLQYEILQCPDAERHRYQPALAQLIKNLKAQGSVVPPQARQLNEELRIEAVEALFDNVPV